jgi:cell fate (sporulation/competence/biofilm development) regulator YmcA (YheA/YmcA/DUF963 family)
MPAPKGNQFYRLRLRHGRHHAIATAEELEENFLEYADYLNDNPLYEIQIHGKPTMPIEVPKMRAMQKDAFALACGVCEWDIINGYRQRGEDFNQVVTRIERYIETQQFEGASSGFFNPNIIARKLGLTDRTDNKHEFKGLEELANKLPDFFADDEK